MATIEISCVEVWHEISNYLDEEILASCVKEWKRISKSARIAQRYSTEPETS